MEFRPLDLFGRGEFCTEVSLNGAWKYGLNQLEQDFQALPELGEELVVADDANRCQSVDLGLQKYFYNFAHFASN